MNYVGAAEDNLGAIDPGDIGRFNPGAAADCIAGTRAGMRCCMLNRVVEADA